MVGCRVGCQVLTSRDQLTVDERIDTFLRAASGALAFLGIECGFGEPLAEIDRRASVARLTWTKSNLAIESYFDFGESDVGIAILRLEGGRRPSGYNVDPQGRRFRIDLHELLIKRGVRDFALRPSGPESEAERLHRVLARYAELLALHANDVLAATSSIPELEPDQAR